jgi:flagellar M-ring protein FliF
MHEWILFLGCSGLALAVAGVMFAGIVRPALKPVVHTAHAPLASLTGSAAPDSPAPPSMPNDGADAAAEVVAAENSAENVNEPAPGESLEEFRQKLKQSAAQKKPAITADMLDMANSYEDKVALVRMLVSEDSSRVATVMKKMIEGPSGKNG